MANVRLDYAKAQLDIHNIEYYIKNETTGHIHCRRKSDDKLFQYYAITGSIVGSDKKGIHNLISILNDNDTDVEENEMIISIYDYMYTCSVKINGVTPSNEHDICFDFANTKTYEIMDFMKRHNIHRLIVCEDGGIEIYTR